MSKHTPGPWEVFRASDGRISIRANAGGDSVLSLGLFQREADARLIAAAPAQHEALYVAAEALSCVASNTGLPCGECLPCKAFPVVQAALALVDG